MTIHSIIRHRRIRLGMTQEQLAEALGVSAPAVNKWEKGIHCPDIALLAPLARLLKMDLNELFAFRSELTPREVLQKTQAVMARILAEGYAAGEEAALEEMREYPDSGALAFSLASALEVLLPAGEGSEKQAAITRLYEQAARGDDAPSKALSLARLAMLALEAGEEEKAQQYYSQLPEEPALRKKELLARMHSESGEKTLARQTYQQLLLMDAGRLMTTLLRLVELSGDDPPRSALLAGRIEQLAEILDFPQITLYQLKLRQAAEREDVRESLRLMEEMVGKDTLRFPQSPLYSELQQKAQDPMMPQLMGRMLQKEIEEEERYHYLRVSPEYRAWKERMQSGK